MNSTSRSSSLESDIVTVKLSHCDSEVRLRKFAGLPANSGPSLAARVVQSFQAGSLSSNSEVTRSGGEFIDPSEEADTILPFVTKTKSSEPTLISSDLPTLNR